MQSLTERLKDDRFLVDYKDVAVMLDRPESYIHKIIQERGFPEPYIVWNDKKLWQAGTIRQYLKELKL